jgi:nucleoside-diphosphate-sugar epimerase
MRILITGGLGHIGSALIKYWTSRYTDEIIVLDNLHTQRFPIIFNLPQGVTFIEADVRGDLRPYCEDVDIIVHLAAITDAASSHEMKDLVFDVNQNGMWNVLHACMEHGCKLIFPSTTSVYGKQESGTLSTETLDEDAKLMPQTPYAESKMICEQMISDLTIPHTIFRFGTIFGPSLGMRFHTAINNFLWNAAQGKPIEVWEGVQKQYRPYLDLGDACRAIEYAIRQEIFDNEIYNVATLNASVLQIIERIDDHFDYDLEMNFVQHELINQLSYHVSTEKWAETGFEYVGDLDRGIKDTLRFLKALGGARMIRKWNDQKKKDSIG